MIDQQRRLREPLRWTRAGRLAVAGTAAALVLATLALGIYAAVGGFDQRAQPGCIDLTFASTTGGATLHACGARAREVCAAPQEHPQVADALRGACKQAGYPYGGPSTRR